jgi:hypothetical protein
MPHYFSIRREVFRLGAMLTPSLTRRRLAGCAFLTLLAIAGGAWWVSSSDRVTRGNFDRIRFGASLPYVPGESKISDDCSTYDDVVAILGQPQDVFSMLSPGHCTCEWEGVFGSVDIEFAYNRALFGRFVATGFMDHVRQSWGRATNRPAPF